MDIGFIGIGNMGLPMARRLIDAGHRLFVHDLNENAVKQLTTAGAISVASPAEAASRAETVMASLPTPDIVRAVALGADGVVEGRKIKRFVDLSTTGSRMAVHIALKLAERNIVHIDSPVSGGVPGAVKGTLAVMVSGPRSEFALLESVLKTIGKVFFVGEKSGLGQTMKLVNNFLSATALAASSEAMVAGAKAGIDPAVMVDVINAGSGRNTATQDKFPRAILPGTFDYGFATGLMYKDVRLFAEEAEHLGVPLIVGSSVRQLWQIANTQIGGDKDFTTVVQCVENWAGAEVRSRKPR